jgi:putative membrane protein
MKTFVIVIAAWLQFPNTGAHTQGVDDAQIASIVVPANQLTSTQESSRNPRQAAPTSRRSDRRMITDHTAVNKLATELAARLGITPQDNPTSQSLKSDGEKSLADLKSLKGSAFDKAYIDREVAYHEQVFDALDKSMIPGAKNQE